MATTGTWTSTDLEAWPVRSWSGCWGSWPATIRLSWLGWELSSAFIGDISPIASKSINRVSYFLETTIRKWDIVGARGPVPISVFILTIVVTTRWVINLPVEVVDSWSSLRFPVRSWSRSWSIRALWWGSRCRGWLVLALSWCSRNKSTECNEGWETL